MPSSVSGFRPPSPPRFTNGPHVEEAPSTSAAGRPTNAKLSGDAIKQSGKDTYRLISNTGGSLASIIASGTSKLAGTVERHAATLSPNTQPKRHEAAMKTSAGLKYLAKHSEKAALTLIKLSKVEPAHPPKRSGAKD